MLVFFQQSRASQIGTNMYLEIAFRVVSSVVVIVVFAVQLRNRKREVLNGTLFNSPIGDDSD